MLKAKFNKLYLVAVGGSAGTEFRVTEREAGVRPATISFTRTKTDVEQSPVGTLMLDEAVWKGWFGTRKTLPGMETAASAADKLVKVNADIYYGCPICDEKFKDAEPHTKHINEHLSRLLNYLDVSITEES